MEYPSVFQIFQTKPATSRTIGSNQLVPSSIDLCQIVSEKPLKKSTDTEDVTKYLVSSPPPQTTSTRPTFTTQISIIEEIVDSTTTSKFPSDLYS